MDDSVVAAGVGSGVGVASGVPTVGPHNKPMPTISAMATVAAAKPIGSM
jgi:hypothetical protein